MRCSDDDKQQHKRRKTLKNDPDNTLWEFQLPTPCQNELYEGQCGIKECIADTRFHKYDFGNTEFYSTVSPAMPLKFALNVEARNSDVNELQNVTIYHEETSMKSLWKSNCPACSSRPALGDYRSARGNDTSPYDDAQISACQGFKQSSSLNLAQYHASPLTNQKSDDQKSKGGVAKRVSMRLHPVVIRPVDGMAKHKKNLEEEFCPLKLKEKDSIALQNMETAFNRIKPMQAGAQFKTQKIAELWCRQLSKETYSIALVRFLFRLNTILAMAKCPSIKYPSLPSFLKSYPKFEDYDEGEQIKLWRTANFMMFVFQAIKAKTNKGKVLSVVTKFVGALNCNSSTTILSNQCEIFLNWQREMTLPT